MNEIIPHMADTANDPAQSKPETNSTDQQVLYWMLTTSPHPASMKQSF